MRATSFLAAAAALAGHAIAQTNAGPTASLFLPLHASNLGASIVTAAPSSTVYAISCLQQKNACAAGCGLNSTITVTEGPSTLAYTWTDSDRASILSSGGKLQHPVTTVNCALNGNSSAVCTGVWANGTKSASQTTTLTGNKVTYLPVAITAGGANQTYTSSSPSGTGSASGSSTAKPTSPAGSSTNGASSKSILGYGVGIAAGLGALAVL